MSTYFQNKIVLVTGGAQGMGFDTAKAFANQGEKIIIADLTSDEYDRILNINLKGVWLCMKYELLQMRQQGSGAIVNCSSLGG